MVDSEATDMASPRQDLESQTLVVNICLVSCPADAICLWLNSLAVLFILSNSMSSIRWQFFHLGTINILLWGLLCTVVPFSCFFWLLPTEGHWHMSPGMTVWMFPDTASSCVAFSFKDVGFLFFKIVAFWWCVWRLLAFPVFLCRSVFLFEMSSWLWEKALFTQ